MAVLFIILGILLVIVGFSCIFTPLLTFMSAGYFILILVGVFGVLAIIKAVSSKKYGINFVFGILSVIFAVILLFFPDVLVLTNGLMLYLTAAWFIMMGIVTIVNSVTITKPMGSGLWVLQLIFGILSVILGIFAIFNPMFMAISIGVLIGIFFIGSILLFFMGLMGEYIMSINQRVMNRPLVIEEERINFAEKQKENESAGTQNPGERIENK